MAKDDFYYIAFKILTYLYTCEKSGEPIDKTVFEPQNYRINYSYLGFVFKELSDEGYIKGLDFMPTKSDTIVDFDEMRISIKGIDFLEDNDKMKKAY
ncbi:hypothetical protein RyT2_15020 [Pseudolactococcus yaeyamensis]